MKKELRSKYLDLRSRKEEEYLKKSGRIIADKLMVLPCYRNARTVMVYISVGCEVDTYYLINNMLFDIKKVCVPVCNTKSLSMEAHRLRSLSDLTTGAYGIPVPKKRDFILKDEIDLCIVPGCVFGKNMHRIGYGKGYYDRFLRGTEAKKVGFCYDFSLIASLEHDGYDVPLDIILTEKQMFSAE